MYSIEEDEIQLCLEISRDDQFTRNLNDLNESIAKVLLELEEIVNEEESANIKVGEVEIISNDELTKDQTDSLFYGYYKNGIDENYDESDVITVLPVLNDRDRKKKIVDSTNNLRSYQKQLGETINSAHESEDLRDLLCLNDRMSSVLGRADSITKDQTFVNTENYSSNLNETNETHQSIGSTVYTLTRGAVREDTLEAVNRMMRYCGLGTGDTRLDAVKAMMSVGALEALLSALTRAGDLPEVETQISKLIAVLVTYEDNWALLQRNAVVILSALYTLQMKNQATLLSRTKYSCVAQPAVLRATSGEDINVEINCKSNKNGSDDITGKGFFDADVKNTQNFTVSKNQETNNNNNNMCNLKAYTNSNNENKDNNKEYYGVNKRDVRTLISAAITKLSLVLSTEWRKLETSGRMHTKLPFNNNGNNNASGANIFSFETSHTFSSSDYKHNISNVGDLLSNSFSNAASNATNRTRARPTSNESDVLKIIVNMVLTICESSFSAVIDNNINTSPACNSQASTPSPSLNVTRQVSDASDHNNSDAKAATTSFTKNQLDNSFKHHTLVTACIENSNTKRVFAYTLVDSPSVLCSAALSNLAEVPQCRPGLVSSGALRVIKCWFEIGVQVLKEAKTHCSELSSKQYSENDNKQLLLDEAYSQFIKSYSKAYELITNAAAALMYLAGGSDCRYSKPQWSAQSNSVNGGHDYIVGWIDAQILATGLPALIIKLISTSIVDSSSIFPDPDNNEKTTVSVLPAVVGMHLAQTLFQLCSRVQNRHQFQVINVSNALCILFENIISQIKVFRNKDSSPSQSTIYSRIFLIDGVYNRGTHAGSITMNKSEFKSTNDLVTLYATSIDDKNNNCIAVNPTVVQHGKKSPLANAFVLKNTTSPASAKSLKAAKHTNESFASPTPATAKVCVVDEENSNDQATNKNMDDKLHHDFLMLMSSITSSCLDTLTFFVVDETSKCTLSAPLAIATNATLGFSSFTATAASIVTSTVTNTTNVDNHVSNNVITKPIFLLELLTQTRMVDAILTAASALPKGSGRLGAVRLIWALSLSPLQAVGNLYDSALIDVLVVITSESLELKLNTVQKHAKIYSSNNSILPSTARGTSAPQESYNHGLISMLMQRNTSGGSSVSEAVSMSSRGSHYNYKTTDRTTLSSIHASTYRDDEEEDEFLRNMEIDTEETIDACYALANIGELHEKYAQRMFNSGLFSLMVQLVKSDNMDISRQALRSLSAMCPVIYHETTEKGLQAKAKDNNLYVSAIEALTYALKSPNSQVQRGAVHAISLIALINEQIKNEIVEGPLRIIISLLVDPKNDRDIRGVAEEVLKNLGFLGGAKDFELCGFDVQILLDWYAMKQSLKPQDHSYVVLCEWIEKLFFRDDNDSSLEANLHHQRNSFSDSNLVVSILEKTNISVSSLKNLDHHLSPNNLSTNSKQQSVLNRSLTDNFFKFVASPFCFSNKTHSKKTSGKSTSYKSGKNLNYSDKNPSKHQNLKQVKSVENSNNNNLYAIQQSYSASSLYLNDNESSTTAEVINNSFDHNSISEGYDWLDVPPESVTNVFDLFYNSKLHQMLLMDLTSLGIPLSVSTAKATSDSNNENQESSKCAAAVECIATNDDNSNASFFDENNNNNVYCETYNCIPRPNRVSAILLPSRTYQSFTRVGRVLEKMFEYSASQSKLWSVTFRDCEFLGDFHPTISSFLRRCPQVVSLSFCSQKRVEEDAWLGHLGGDIPPSIRFLSFQNTLSKLSVIALCIILKKQNASFLAPEFENYVQHANNNLVKDTNATDKQQSKKAIRNSSDKRENNLNSLPSKGLLGLALTDFSFDYSEIEQIAALLQCSHENTANGLNKISNNSSKKLASGFLKGLRYIDLSSNGLNDESCAKILTSALTGPLEGLELSGNNIKNGEKFLEAIEVFHSTQHSNYLRHLGLSKNNLSIKFVSSLLRKLIDNKSLTSLDLSGNEIGSNPENHDLLKSFVKSKTGLRALNLCDNKLTIESFRQIQLGVLENDHLLLLPLAGNPDAEKVISSASITLIQSKLSKNRLLYGKCTKSFFGSVASSKTKLKSSSSFVVNNNEAFGCDNRGSLSDRMSISAAFDFDSNIATTTAIPFNSTLNSNAATVTATHFPVDSSSNIGNCTNNNYNSISNAVQMPFVDVHTQKNTYASASSNLNVLHDESDEKAKTTVVAIPIGRCQQSKNNSTFMHQDNKTLNSDSFKTNSAHALSIADSKNNESKSISTMNLKKNNNYNSSINNSIPESPTNRNRRLSREIFPLNSFNSKLSAATSTADSYTALDYLNAYSDKTARIKPNNSNILSVSSTSPFANYSSAPVANQHQPSTTLTVFFSAPLAGKDAHTKRMVPLEMLDYTSERDVIIQVFKEVHRDVCVHFDFATTDSLRTQLSLGCRALHFSGHGLSDGLCFEDKGIGLQVIGADYLKDLLSAGGLSLEFVFVSACHSKEIGDAFVKAGVPHVVCVKIDSQIQDSAAISFTRAFYVAFLSGKTVRDSFLIAKEALKTSPYVPNSIFEGEKFILIPEAIDNDNDNTSNKAVKHASTSTGTFDKYAMHRKAIFQQQRVTSWPQAGHCTIGRYRWDVQAFCSRQHRLPHPPADFEGRQEVVHNVVNIVLERRFVSLIGDDGVGKSTVVAVVCKYISDRELFEDSVVFLKAKGLKDHRSFLSALHHTLLTSGNFGIVERMKHVVANNAAPSSTTAIANLVYPEEEIIFSCLEPLQVLLVIDHIDDLIGDYNEISTDFKLFLGRLFEVCHRLKLLTVSTERLRNVGTGFDGTFEYPFRLLPLSLHRTLRLFARLAPSLSGSQEKNEFMKAMQPNLRDFQPNNSNNDADVEHATISSLNSERVRYNPEADILKYFGNGNPAKIVHMACESSCESIEKLKNIGRSFYKNYSPATIEATMVVENVNNNLESSYSNKNNNLATVSTLSSTSSVNSSNYQSSRK